MDAPVTITISSEIVDVLKWLLGGGAVVGGIPFAYPVWIKWLNNRNKAEGKEYQRETDKNIETIKEDQKEMNGFMNKAITLIEHCVVLHEDNKRLSEKQSDWMEKFTHEMIRIDSNVDNISTLLSDICKVK